MGQCSLTQGSGCTQTPAHDWIYPLFLAAHTTAWSQDTYIRVPAYQNEEQHRKHMSKWCDISWFDSWWNMVEPSTRKPKDLKSFFLPSPPRSRLESSMPPCPFDLPSLKGTCPAELNCSATTAHGEVKSKRISIEEKVRRPHPPIQSLCDKEPLVS